MKDAIMVVGSDIDAYECNLTNFNLGSKAGGGGDVRDQFACYRNTFAFLLISLAASI